MAALAAECPKRFREGTVLFYIPLLKLADSSMILRQQSLIRGIKDQCVSSIDQLARIGDSYPNFIVESVSISGSTSNFIDELVPISDSDPSFIHRRAAIGDSSPDVSDDMVRFGKRNRGFIDRSSCSANPHQRNESPRFCGFVRRVRQLSAMLQWIPSRNRNP